MSTLRCIAPGAVAMLVVVAAAVPAAAAGRDVCDSRPRVTGLRVAERVEVGQRVTLRIRGRYSGGRATAVAVDWGDGQRTHADLLRRRRNSKFVLRLSHTYKAARTYTIGVRATGVSARPRRCGTSERQSAIKRAEVRVASRAAKRY